MYLGIISQYLVQSFALSATVWLEFQWQPHTAKSVCLILVSYDRFRGVGGSQMATIENMKHTDWWI